VTSLTLSKANSIDELFENFEKHCVPHKKRAWGRLGPRAACLRILV